MGPVEADTRAAAAPVDGLTRRQVAWDLALATVCVAVAVVVQASGLDAVPANRAPDAWSVLFTVVAVGPLLARRRAPLIVLVTCIPGLLALVAWRYQVGAASLGFLVAFYTVAAWGSARDARRAIGVLTLTAMVLVVLRPIDLSVEGALSSAAVLLGGWVVGTGNRDRRALHAIQVAEVERRIESERDRAAVQERLRLSRELHDILGHAMSVMVVQAGVAEHLLDNRPEQARAAIDRIGQTGRASLQEIRQLLGNTRGSGNDSPLRPQPRLVDVPDLVARVEASGLPVQLDLAPADPDESILADDRITAGVQLAVYRVIQEALTNSLRHAGPARARVRLTRTVDAVQVEVVDNGRGPEPELPVPAGTRQVWSAAPHRAAVPMQEGQGLIGMRERVAAYNGDLTTGAAPRGGFRVWARFPLPTASTVDPHVDNGAELAGDVIGEPA
jgi:signal transduction histidine kinase